MIPLEEREGKGTWVMGGEALVSLVSGVCLCECVDSGGWTGREVGRRDGLDLGSGDGGQMDHNEILLSIEHSEWHYGCVVVVILVAVLREQKNKQTNKIKKI